MTKNQNPYTGPFTGLLKNSQPVEKRTNTTSLEVHSIFYTFQGEGPYTGRPAVFVRLAGCNLQCPLCDTEYTSQRTTMTPDEICTAVKNTRATSKCTLVVITGGEPFRQAKGLYWLALELGVNNFTVQVETNGTLPPYEKWNHFTAEIVVSPKTGHVNKNIALFAKAYKYVAQSSDIAEDGLPNSALGLDIKKPLARPPVGKPVYLQPADEVDALLNYANMQAVSASCLRHGYIAQIQTHKIWGVE